MFTQWIINQPNPPPQTLRRTAPRVGFDPINHILASRKAAEFTQGSDAWPPYKFTSYTYILLVQLPNTTKDKGKQMSPKCLWQNTSFIVARLGWHVHQNVSFPSLLGCDEVLRAPCSFARAGKQLKWGTIFQMVYCFPRVYAHTVIA